jgi:branched-chain amino acid transport system substrate-binding protein
MRKLLQACLWAATTVAALAAGPARSQELVIGLQAPLTGSQSQYGELFRNGAQLMVDAVNAQGGVHGRKVRLALEDSKGDPKEGVAIAQKFAEDPRVLGVIGDFGSSVSMAAAEVYARAGLPQLTPSSSHPDFTRISKWQFRNIFTQAHEGRFTAQWLREAGVRSAAVLALQNDFGQAVTDNFARNFEALQGKVVARELVVPGTRDFRATLTRIARGKPDAIFLGLFYEEGALVMQQARQLGLDVRFFSGAGIYSPRLIELGGKAVDGLQLTSGFYPASTEPRVQGFVTGSAPKRAL